MLENSTSFPEDPSKLAQPETNLSTPTDLLADLTNRVVALGAKVMELAQCPFRDEFDPTLLRVSREWDQARIAAAKAKGATEEEIKEIRLRPWISY